MKPEKKVPQPRPLAGSMPLLVTMRANRLAGREVPRTLLALLLPLLAQARPRIAQIYDPLPPDLLQFGEV